MERSSSNNDQRQRTAAPIREAYKQALIGPASQGAVQKGNSEVSIQRTLEKNPLFKPAVSEISDDLVFNTVVASIAKCYTDLNQKNPDDDTKAYMANEVTDIVLKKYPSIRLHEIPQAFAKGIRGQYGEYFGLSVITFEMFIDRLMCSDERMSYGKEAEQVRYQLEAKALPTNDEIFTTAKDLVIQDFELMKAARFRRRTAIVNYNFLCDIGICRYSAAKRKEFAKEAIYIVMKEMEADFINSNEIWQRRDLMGQMEVFKHCVENDLPFSESHSALIIDAAKRLAFKTLLESCIIGSIDLGALIEEKRQEYLSSLIEVRLTDHTEVENE